MLIVLLAACGLPKGMPDPTDPSGPRDVVAVTMPDGVALDTHVLLPAGAGPFPTLLYRTPYPMGPILDQRCRMFNRYGYACVWQSVRGRNRSDGAWVPLEHEPADGRATLDWLVQQPFVDGNIALLGESYLGATQWAVAGGLPPQVKTFVPTVIGADLYGAIYEGGLFRHEIATAWMSMMPDERFRLLSGGRGYHRALAHRPRRTMDEVATKSEVPWFRAWVDNDRPTDPFWTRDLVAAGQAAPASLTVPVLMLGGWADAFLGAQLDAWQSLATRDQSTLVVGPWDHLGRSATDPTIPEIASRDGLEHGLQWPRVLDWLDHHLRGRPSRFPVGVVTWPVGGEAWETRVSWPPATEDRTYSLTLGADPQKCTGALVDVPPVDPKAAKTRSAPPPPPSTITTWTYDPADPTPSVGGDGILAGVITGWHGVPPGFVDQEDLCEAREDLVGFRSAALGAPLHVAGAISATLAVASSAPDSAFGVRVVEEKSDGTRIVVREAFSTLSFRDGPEIEAPYTPGDVVTVPLTTTPIEYVFQPWSRVVVEVSSASFPRLEAHSNLAEPWAASTRTVPAQQQLHLEASLVVLPVVAP